MKLPTNTTLEPLNEAMQMLVECIHDVVECYEIHHKNRITFTRNGVDFTAYIWPTDEPSMPGDDLVLKAGRNEDGSQAPVLTIKADGTFWIGDKEVPGGEEFRDLFVKFVEGIVRYWITRAEAEQINKLKTRITELEDQIKREKFLGAH